MKTVCFVGISNKEGKKPFDSTTNSGKVIDQIISQVDVNCEKVNYVSFVPTDDFGKIRYPSKTELEESFPLFQKKVYTMNPDLLIVCGKMIARQLKKHNFYQDKMLEVVHPSYIWVYKRAFLHQYIQEIVMKIQSLD